MAAIHYVGVPCATKAKTLETTSVLNEVTCKRCLKKLQVANDPNDLPEPVVVAPTLPVEGQGEEVYIYIPSHSDKVVLAAPSTSSFDDEYDDPNDHSWLEDHRYDDFIEKHVTNTHLEIFK